MKSIKYFTVFILVLCLCQLVVAEKRRNPKPMKEFTDPSSPSYVPYPYPKNREEIIADLKYALKKLFGDKRKGVFLNGKEPEVRKLLAKIAEENSIYKVGDIIKVKNRNHKMADDYTWLILVEDQNGEAVSRIAMAANGLYLGGGPTKYGIEYHKKKHPNSTWSPKYLMKDEYAIKRLSEDLEKSVGKHEIKRMERVAFQSILASPYLPMFEIKMNSGKIYYYSVKTDEVYEIEEIKNWKKDEWGSRLVPRQLIPRDKKYVTDSVKEEIIVLKALKEKVKENHFL
jgi:hypothetical protein